MKTGCAMARKAQKTSSNGRGGTSTRPAAFDSELDALFASAAPMTTAKVPATIQTSSSRKRKAYDGGIMRHTSSPEAESLNEDSEAGSASVGVDLEGELKMSGIEREMEEQGLGRRPIDDEKVEEFEKGDSGANETSCDVEMDSSDENDDEDDEGDEEEEATKSTTHEFLLSKVGNNCVRRKLQERTQESEGVRDKRSIFVGNLPIDCVESKSLTKALHKHIVAHSPYPSITRIESLRYRSVAFSRPTADYAAQSGAEAAANERRRARAKAFKDAVAAAEAADGKGSTTVYLNAKQKCKVAAINREINDKAKSVNAYVTLEKLRESDLNKLTNLAASTSTTVQGHPERVTPPILAALTAANADETLFQGRHLRLDIAVALSIDELVASGLDRFVSSGANSAAAETLSRILSAGGSGGSGRKEDRNKTIFVGNLEFEADEEDLRSLLEGVLREERGSPPEATFDLSAELSILPPFETKDDAASSIRQTTWVQAVRIVRDPATQMGKGFAYVRFSDEICVDELMAIWEADEAFLAAAKGGPSPVKKDGLSIDGNDGKREDGSRVDFKRRLKLNKRPLRLERCKSTGSTSNVKRRKASHGRTSASQRGSTSGTPTRQRGPAINGDGARRRRSVGAPTPGGSSPSLVCWPPRLQRGDGYGSPKPRSKSRAAVLTGKDAGKAAAAAAAPAEHEQLSRKTPVFNVPNPSPLRLRSASDLARLELKRNDPERQAKRLAKKERRRADLVQGKRQGKKDKVNLYKQMKQHQHLRRPTGPPPEASSGDGKTPVAKRKRKK